MTVAIPCLSCRRATPAGEDAAAISCAGCGAALPPPGLAAWLMLRDGARYGPYTIAQLAAWNAEGRLLPKDHIWYRGAAVRLEVERMPSFGPVEPAGEAEQPQSSEPASIPEPEAVAGAVEPEPSEPAPAPEPEPEPAEAAEQPTPGPEPAEPQTEPEPEPEPAPAEADAPAEPAATEAPEPASVEPSPGEGEALPRLIVHIPCLGCRSVTPVPEEAQAVSCQGCGAALPPPAQAAWLMLRDGAQYGPYTTGQLAGFIAERRILPKDSVWYQGAPVRLEAGQLPPFGEVEDQPAPEPTPVETPAAVAAPAEPGAPAMPAVAAADLGEGDWDSLDIQAGETELGNWIVGLVTDWRDVAGSLIVTDKRLLFKPKIAGATLGGILASQTKGFKDGHTIILPRELIVGVESKRQVLNKYIYVTLADGGVLGFNRGVMSADPILAALQPR
jgi:ribosomal protein S27E